MQWLCLQGVKLKREGKLLFDEDPRADNLKLWQCLDEAHPRPRFADTTLQIHWPWARVAQPVKPGPFFTYEELQKIFRQKFHRASWAEESVMTTAKRHRL